MENAELTLTFVPHTEMTETDHFIQSKDKLYHLEGDTYLYMKPLTQAKYGIFFLRKWV